MSPQRYIFRRRRLWFTSPLHIFVLATMIWGGLMVTQGFKRGDVKPLFDPTPTPTRIPQSFALEAETHFQAGDLDAAIASYQEAITANPENGRLYAEMARILTYSTETQTTVPDKQARFTQAMEASQKAIELSPDDSTAFAVRAFVLDWYYGFNRYILGDTENADRLLTEAEQMVNKAMLLDETNVLALVYYAEVMIDHQRWDLAGGAISRALDRAPDLWEAHRVNGQYLENMAEYLPSIEEYKRASELAPNMTFLQIKLGMAYRTMGLKTGSESYYNLAIDYFDRVARRNETLGIKDPLPYLGIGRVYGQLGLFQGASLNMNKALQYDPASQDVYAQLGMVYRQARNYEDAISALGCAVQGCNEEQTCDLRDCNPEVDPPIKITPMELDGSTIVYYYTYASLLAGMHLKNHPERSKYCGEAIDLIAEIRQSSFADQSIMDILAPSENICRAAMGGPTMTPRPEPTVTPDPEGEE